MNINKDIIPFTTIATVVCISVSSADQIFHVNPTPEETIEKVAIIDRNTTIEFKKQSVEFITEIKENNDMIINDLALEKQEHGDIASYQSFVKAEAYIKSLQAPFFVSPSVFVRPSGHPAFYWGLGHGRHITLSVIDDDLLLSIVFPESDIRIVKPSNISNFNALAQNINDYLG